MHVIVGGSLFKWRSLYCGLVLAVVFTDQMTYCTVFVRSCLRAHISVTVRSLQRRYVFWTVVRTKPRYAKLVVLTSLSAGPLFLRSQDK